MTRRLVVLIVPALIVLAACSGSTPATPGATPSAPASVAPAGTSTFAASAPVAAAGTTVPAPVGVRCGVERWPVKTLSDRDAGRVNFSPVLASVAQLRALPAPAALPQAARVAPVETTTYSVEARVVEFKLEQDRDIHVVIADLQDPSQTMIVEFADAASCSGAVGSAHAPEMEAARAALVAAFGPPSTTFIPLSGMGTFTGVGFFDVPHGQSGVAPNAIELHPVLAFTASSAVPNTVPTATPAGPTAPPALAGVTFVSVVGGPPGGTASAAVQTAPGVSCTITYVTPAGTVSRAQGLYPKTADSTGTVSWTWSIGSSTRPGTGTVTVTCGGMSASAPIAIG